MSEIAENNDESALDWLFAQARNYPLLTAAEEKATDQEKWRALATLQKLFVTDDHCRTYLRHWAINLLHNPPDVERFKTRQHYFLLRREHVDLLEGGTQRDALALFDKCLSEPAAGDRDVSAIERLQLPAGLVAGIAEVLLDTPNPSGPAAALRYWHGMWRDPPGAAGCTVAAKTARSMRKHLARYYSAREKLVNHNLRLVFSIAGRLSGRDIPYRDLIQNGVMGLIRAAEKFQQARGYRFSTYAYNWINQSVRRAIEDQQGIVRYPSGVNEQISRMYRERIEHLNRTGTEPDPQTLARRMKMKPEALQRLRQVSNLSISLDAPSGHEPDGPTLVESIAGGPFLHTAASAERESLHRHLMRSIKILEPSEQRVIVQRWGLDQRSPLTRAQIAEQMQVSTEWVRQLEVSALAKLRDDEGVVRAYEDHQDVDI